MESVNRDLNLNSSHYCYLLVSETKKKASYIGYSVNPCRRLRQHNGEIKNGAKKTKSGTPWEIGICVGGFPNRISALRFEWAWQHPNICRATRDYLTLWKIVKNNGRKKGTLNKRQWSIQQRIWILVCIVTLTPWKDMNLTVLVLNDSTENIIKEYIGKLGKVENNYELTNLEVNSLLMFAYSGSDIHYKSGTRFLKCDYCIFKQIQNDVRKQDMSNKINLLIESDAENLIRDNSVFLDLEDQDKQVNVMCVICQLQIVENRKYISLPCCDLMNIHISCIHPWGESSKPSDEGNLFETSAPLIPDWISCPCCFKTYCWSEIKQKYIKQLEPRKEEEIESGSLDKTGVANSNSASLWKEGTDPTNGDKENSLFSKDYNNTNKMTHFASNCVDSVSRDNNTKIDYCNKGIPLFPDNDNDMEEVYQKCEFIDLTVDSE